MEFSEFLDQLTSQSLADALGSLNMSKSGSKAERVQRLLTCGKPVNEILEMMTVPILQEACWVVGVPTGRKSEMVERIRTCLTVGDTVVATPSRPLPKPASKENVLDVLKQLRIPRRKAKDEYSAQNEIILAVEEHFEDVASPYNIGGYYGLVIDIDLGNGQVGIEVKLASSLQKSAEAHRLIGQAVYYQRRRYGENLIVAVVGDDYELRDLGVRETLAFLQDMGISTVAITTM